MYGYDAQDVPGRRRVRFGRNRVQSYASPDVIIDGCCATIKQIKHPRGAPPAPLGLIKRYVARSVRPSTPSLPPARANTWPPDPRNSCRPWISRTQSATISDRGSRDRAPRAVERRLRAIYRFATDKNGQHPREGCRETLFVRFELRTSEDGPVSTCCAVKNDRGVVFPPKRFSSIVPRRPHCFDRNPISSVKINANVSTFKYVYLMESYSSTESQETSILTHKQMPCKSVVHIRRRSLNMGLQYILLIFQMYRLVYIYYACRWHNSITLHNCKGFFCTISFIVQKIENFYDRPQVYVFVSRR